MTMTMTSIFIQDKGRMESGFLNESKEAKQVDIMNISSKTPQFVKQN